MGGRPRTADLLEAMRQTYLGPGTAGNRKRLLRIMDRKCPQSLAHWPCLFHCQENLLALAPRQWFNFQRQLKNRTKNNKKQICVASATGCPENRELSKPVAATDRASAPTGRGLARLLHRRFAVPRDGAR